MKSRCRFAFLCSIIPFILTGCWDEVEIDKQVFIAAVAIDLAEDSDEEALVEVTEHLIVPPGLGSLTNPREGKAYHNLSSTGKTIYETSKAISRQESRKANVEHLGLVLISREFAEMEGMLKNIFDVFIREQYMRRGILVVITEGKAKEALHIDAEHVSLPSVYIVDMLENDQTTMTKDPVKLGDIHEKLLTNRSYSLPYLSVVTEKILKYDGVAVIAEKPSRMVGALTGDISEDRHFISGKARQSVVTIQVEGNPATLEINELRSRYVLLNENPDALHFRVDIELDALIKEYVGQLDLYDEENMKIFTEALENEVHKRAVRVLEEVKDGMQVDILKFDDFLRIHHNELWEEIKNDWDYGANYFADSDITIVVEANIESPGTSLKGNQ